MSRARSVLANAAASGACGRRRPSLCRDPQPHRRRPLAGRRRPVGREHAPRPVRLTRQTRSAAAGPPQSWLG
eukprot:9941894-Lingulodinium_polyedra.AAC.1